MEQGVGQGVGQGADDRIRREMNATVKSGPPARVCRAARVLANERLDAGSHRLSLRMAGPAPDAGPGQFAMLSLDSLQFPLLPRPFSLLGWELLADGDVSVEFLIMPVGRVTASLCDLAVGQSLQLVGPLGGRMDAGFGASALPGALAGDLLCVAGGYGVAPFIFLCERLAAQQPDLLARTTVIYGARSAGKLQLSERLAQTGARVLLCTDDGSAGRAGRVDAALREALGKAHLPQVLTCGPDGMMEAVGRVCADAGVPARASLETVMGCGFAVCNGCAVAVDCATDAAGHTYELACREGTVFDTGRLLWSLL